MRPRDAARELDLRRRRLDRLIATSPSLASTELYDDDLDEPTSPRHGRRIDPDYDLLPGAVVDAADHALRRDVRELAESVSMLLRVVARLALHVAPWVAIVALILSALAVVGATSAVVFVTVTVWGIP